MSAAMLWLRRLSRSVAGGRATRAADPRQRADPQPIGFHNWSS